MKRIVVFISLFFFLISCSKQERLIGTWERLNDDLAGMQVKVEPSGDQMIGKLIKVPYNASRYGFLNGDIKWKNIKKMNENRYEYSDLAKNKEWSNITFEFIDSYIEFADKNTININSITKVGREVGEFQKWKRIK